MSLATDPAVLPGLHRQFQRSLQRVRSDSGLPLAFGGGVAANHQLVLTEFAGHVVGPLRGLVLRQGLGVGGKSLATARAVRVADYVHSGSISHDYDTVIQAECLQGMLAVPVVVQRQVRGVVYGATRDASPLGDRATSAVAEAAREIGQDIAVWDRIQDLSARTSPVPPPPPDDYSRRWEEVREAFAELRALSRTIADSDVRERIGAVCDSLVAAAGASPTALTAAHLSAREVDVLACAATGLTSAEIGTDLGLRSQTVKSYLKSAMRKLNAHTRLEAVAAARRVGALP